MHAARRWPRIAAAALVGIGAAATLWAASELEGGASELLHHWWSTLAVLVPLTAAAVAVGWELAARRIARRTRR
jgi:cytochrome bd-type quinol oxidase subunit 2